MPIRTTPHRRPWRALVLAASSVALALSATPAEAAKKAPTQVRKWSTTTQTVAPGSTVTYPVKVLSRGRASAGRMVVLQRYDSGRWVRATHARTTRYGNVKLRVRFGTREVTHRFRIQVNATGQHKKRITRARKVLVRAAAPTPAPTRAQQVLALVNEARSTRRTCGETSYRARGPLTLNSRLNASAQAHARDMAANDYFSHTGRNGSSVGDRVTAQGYAWSAVGENIAAGQRSVEEVVRGWLESPGHCANIMSGAYTHLGVGYATTSRQKYPTYWVQNFAAPR